MSKHTISHADEFFAGAPYAGGINSSNRGVPIKLVHQQVLLNPIAGDVDGLVTAAGSGATAAAGDVPIDGAFLNAVTGFGDISTARNIIIDSTNAGDTTQVITITGRDIVGNPQVENITANGVTEVAGLKAFSVVESISNSVVFAGNLTVGTSITAANIRFGLDVQLLNLFDTIDQVDAVGAAEGDHTDWIVADVTDPATAITGDTKGTFTPTTLPDGAVDTILTWFANLTKDAYGNNFTG